jgi:hypothetical protein
MPRRIDVGRAQVRHQQLFPAEYVERPLLSKLADVGGWDQGFCWCFHGCF